jgi:hypothetical protein
MYYLAPPHHAEAAPISRVLAVILEGAAAGFFLCVCPRDAGNFLRVFFVGSVITHFFFFFFLS